MDRRRPGSTSPGTRREPIRSPWIFVVVLGLVVAGTPLWYPAGTVEPLVLGVPLWFAVAVLTTVALSAFCSWACLRRWNLVEPVEEAGGAAVGPGTTSSADEDGGHR